MGAATEYVHTRDAATSEQDGGGAIRTKTSQKVAPPTTKHLRTLAQTSVTQSRR